jgi:hypothetical protein
VLKLIGEPGKGTILPSGSATVRLMRLRMSLPSVPTGMSNRHVPGSASSLESGIRLACPLSAMNSSGGQDAGIQPSESVPETPVRVTLAAPLRPKPAGIRMHAPISVSTVSIRTSRPSTGWASGRCSRGYPVSARSGVTPTQPQPWCSAASVVAARARVPSG